MMQQLIWRPLSPVSYVLQLSILGAVLAVSLRWVSASRRMPVLVFGLSAWFAMLWSASSPTCASGAAVPMIALFGVPMFAAVIALLSGESLRWPWVVVGLLAVAHLVHFAVTSSFSAVLCL